MSLMGIGEFAARSRLSHKALRLYDELGLLPPARVDPDSGYRWYAPDQLERAAVVASLRRIGMPLAEIKALLAADSTAAASLVTAYWAQAEAEHVTRRELASYLINHLSGKEPPMHDVTIRDIPARSMLCLRLQVHSDDLITAGRELIARLRPVAPPAAGDPVSAPFLIFYGEVSKDSDGPAEWCWPVPDEQAADLADQFPDLTLRTEPAHQEAFIPVGQLSLAGDTAPIVQSLCGWAATQRLETTDGGVRQIMISNPASGGKGPDGEYALALR